MVELATTHHFNFTVADMDRSLGFWRDTLGLEVLHDWVSDAGYLAEITGYPGVRLRLAFVRLPGRLRGVLDRPEPERDRRLARRRAAAGPPAPPRPAALAGRQLRPALPLARRRRPARGAPGHLRLLLGQAGAEPGRHRRVPAA